MKHRLCSHLYLVDPAGICISLHSVCYSCALCTGCNLILRLFGPDSVSSFSKGTKFLLQEERNFSKSGSDETFVNFEFQTATYLKEVAS